MVNLDAMTAILMMAQEGEHAGSTGVTLLFAGILVAMIAALALEEKIHARKSVITGVAAVVSLLLGTAFHLLPFHDAIIPFGEVEVSMPVYIPAVDWEVIAIILGSSLFVDVTSRSGIFSWIAIRMTKLSGGDPLRLLVAYGVLTVVFSAVLNNVAAMIIVGSLTAVSLKKLDRRGQLLGFLLVEGLLTNIGGLLTLISSVPNIIVGKTAGISFLRFFIVASPYVLLATIATLALGAWIFGISRLKSVEEKERSAELVAGFDENDGIPSRRFFWVSAASFVLFIGALAGQSVLPYLNELGMGYIALSFGFLMLIAYRHEVSRFYSALDWDLLFFFAFLFIVINVMEQAQVLHVLGDWIAALIGDGGAGGVGALLAASAAASSVTDNIPLAAMLGKILASANTPADSPLWWAVVFGANLGGNITPIGSASTVVAVTIIHKYDLKLTFAGFVKAALPFALIQIVLAVLYVLLRFGLLTWGG